MAVFKTETSTGSKVARIALFLAPVILSPLWLVLLLRWGVIPGLGVGYQRTTVILDGASAALAGVPALGGGGGPAQQNLLTQAAAPEQAQLSVQEQPPEQPPEQEQPAAKEQLLPLEQAGLQHLDKELVEKVRNDPSLLEKKGGPNLLSRFEASPWLLPPRTKALPYAGVHDMDKLLKLRAKPNGGFNRTITITLFTRNMAVMAQNCIYGLVKWAGVTNYIVGTVYPEDFEACLDLNLPCTDVSRFLPLPLKKDDAADAYHFGKYNYFVLTFLRPAIVLHLLEKGYVVHNSDTDIGYAPHPLWPSYLNLIAANSADGAFTWEYSVNGGNYVLLPNNQTVQMVKGWVGKANESCNPPEGRNMVHDQDALAHLGDAFWRQCSYRKMCKWIIREKREKNETPVAVIRSFWPPQWMDYPDVCAFSNPADVPVIDVCHWSAMFVHPVCQGDHKLKRSMLEKLGFWYMDDEAGGCPPDNSTASNMPRCGLLRWRDPHAEDKFLSCKPGVLGLTPVVADDEEVESSVKGGSAAAVLKPQ